MKIERVEVRELALPLRTRSRRRSAARRARSSCSSRCPPTASPATASAWPTAIPTTCPRPTAPSGPRPRRVPHPAAPVSSRSRHPRDVWPGLARVRGHEMAKAALEMAVWELWARREGVPLHRVLGGEKTAIEVRRVRGAAGRRSRARAQGRDGGRGRLPAHQDQDQARATTRGLVRALRERFGPVPLMVDANSAYTLDDVAVLRDLDQFGLMMIEQPLAWSDIVDHAALQRELRTPDLPGRVDPLARRRPPCPRPRRLPRHQHQGRAASAASRPAWPSTTSASRAASPSGAAACWSPASAGWPTCTLQTLPGFSLPGDTSASARYFEEDLVDPPVVVSADGLIAVPDGPGIGHEIVWPRVERATVTRRRWP